MICSICTEAVTKSLPLPTNHNCVSSKKAFVVKGFNAWKNATIYCIFHCNITLFSSYYFCVYPAGGKAAAILYLRGRAKSELPIFRLAISLLSIVVLHELYIMSLRRLLTIFITDWKLFQWITYVSQLSLFHKLWGTSLFVYTKIYENHFMCKQLFHRHT